MRNNLILVFLILSFLLKSSFCEALTITIGKGSGILWEGLPFNESISGPMAYDQARPQLGLVSISKNINSCMSDTDLTSINGMLALKIAPGVGLIPRVRVNATWTPYLGTATTTSLSGTVGLPETRAIASDDNRVLTSSPGYGWCVSPVPSITSFFYSTTGPRTASFSGNWALIADGTQKSTTVRIPTMYAGSYSMSPLGNKYKSILPASLSLRISTLECTVNTPTSINFGTVGRNLSANKELGKQTNPLTVACTQATDMIDANIAVQFRSISGLYNSSANRLALTQGGGYVTGEIPGVTSSGICEGVGGISFDSTPINIGSISASQNSTVVNQQFVWRICSGGEKLPTGPVSASTEMLVTFN